MVEENKKIISSLEQLKKLSKDKEISIRIKTLVGGGHGRLDITQKVTYIPKEYRCWIVKTDREERYEELHLSELALEDFTCIIQAIKKMELFLI